MLRVPGMLASMSSSCLSACRCRRGGGGKGIGMSYHWPLPPAPACRPACRPCPHLRVLCQITAVRCQPLPQLLHGQLLCAVQLVARLRGRPNRAESAARMRRACAWARIEPTPVTLPAAPPHLEPLEHADHSLYGLNVHHSAALQAPRLPTSVLGTPPTAGRGTGTSGGVACPAGCTVAGRRGGAPVTFTRLSREEANRRGRPDTAALQRSYSPSQLCGSVAGTPPATPRAAADRSHSFGA